MGTWGVSKGELILKLMECLDNVEGDFDTKTLMDAFDFMRFYCPTSDSNKAMERIWHKKIGGLFA